MNTPNEINIVSTIPDDRLEGKAMPGILKAARRILVGRTITKAVYIESFGEAYPALILDDGTCVLASCDDEGNGPGVLEITGADGGCVMCQTRIKP